MRLWVAVTAWLALNAVYVLVAVRRARRSDPPADGETRAPTGLLTDGRAADPNAAD
ncbi:hypothetical protein OVY01_01630 [Robbsia sp. Bb-Pol-6]|uniref:Uncharacterized protein n=1 Tax=Robbsia betulipollinis TaxID=2981849 RepID=A0ABT3ZHG2_9BURK|nr:hypothetical protein [Robbsia betulipollinis]MCY0385963.1 hypothetical protein [Robbsia betulipollinis]